MGKIFHKHTVHVFFIVTLSLIAYSNTFQVPFQFDDEAVIVDNPIIKNLDYFANPSKAKDFTQHFGYHTFKTRFIGYLSFALNYSINGLNTTGFHIVNLFIHIGTALLVYILILLTWKTPFLYTSNTRLYSGQIAVFTALLFACHPLQTEAVTYIWQRVASLAALLYVLSLVSYVTWRLSAFQPPVSGPPVFVGMRTFLPYFLSIAAALCALNTKQLAFTLPITITLYEVLFLQEKFRKRLLFLTPFFLITAIIPLNLIGIDKPLGAIIGDVGAATRYLTEISRSDYLLTQFRVIITYLRLLLVPVGQNLDYDYPVYHSLFNPEVLLSFLFVSFLFGSGVFLFLRYRHTAPHTRLIAFGILWFFITLSVESSIIPLIHVINEYRMYLPSAGVFLGITSTLFLIVQKLKERGIQRERAAVLILATVILALTGATYSRNTVWKNEITLWQDVVSKSPAKARGYNNLCRAYNSKKLHDKASEQCIIAIQLEPGYALAYNNLGIAYASQGRLNDAIQQFQTAIQLYPSYATPYNNLGIAYASQGRLNDAIEQFQTAIQYFPTYSKAYYNLGNVYISQGLTDKAIQQFQTAINLSPNYVKAHSSLSKAYSSQGLFLKALEHARLTSGLMGSDPPNTFELLP